LKRKGCINDCHLVDMKREDLVCAAAATLKDYAAAAAWFIFVK
jgi:hypothetical protein